MTRAEWAKRRNAAGISREKLESACHGDPQRRVELLLGSRAASGYYGGRGAACRSTLSGDVSCVVKGRRMGDE